MHSDGLHDEKEDVSSFSKVCASGRKNVLRNLLRIPYRRLKASFSVC